MDYYFHAKNDKSCLVLKMNETVPYKPSNKVKENHEVKSLTCGK